MAAENDPELTRDALEALFGIAWEGTAAELQVAMREQVDTLDADARTRLLHGFLDVDRLQALFNDVAAGEVPDHEGMELDPSQKRLVDAALAPLIELYGDASARKAMDDLEPAQRAHLLLSAVSREP